MSIGPSIAAPSGTPSGHQFTARVIVAHSAALVCAGLASMLRSSSQWDVHMWQEASAQSSQASQALSPILVGDVPMLTQALAKAGLGHKHLPGPRVVLVADDQLDAQSDIADIADASVSIRCQADELIDTIHRLAALGPSPSARCSSPSVARGGLAPGVLRRVREFVWSHLAERIEVADLAAIADLSECHFGKAFKQSVGIPPHRYVMQCRVEKAASLIRQTDRPLAQIAFEVGFSDQSHFTRTFSQVTGEKPRSFRIRCR